MIRFFYIKVPCLFIKKCVIRKMLIQQYSNNTINFLVIKNYL